MEKELQTVSGSLFYEREGDEITISGYHGRDAALVIPERIDDCPVTVIGKKAFLGQKYLLEVSLPETITYVEDWAFAHCDMLKEIALYPKTWQIGKGVFFECNKLAKANLLEEPEYLMEYSEEQRRALMQSVSGLLMSTMTVLDAPYLFDPAVAGSDEWMDQYDARLMTLLSQDDMEGYANTISCGEEDYGNTNQEHFVSQKRKSKVRMILVRLLHDYGISEEKRLFCEQYLRKHMPPEEHTESWQVVKEEHGHEQAFFTLLCDCGCVTKDNIDELIQDLGTENPERKAFLMRYKQEHFETEDFFAAFSL